MSKKDKKILITVSAIILLIIMSVILAFVVSKAYMTNSVRTFLSEKYGADKSEFELVDFNKSHFYFTADAIPELDKTYNCWEFKYNGRDFFVVDINGKYYDDYQLEDVEKWCVEWLKENIDESIFFISVDSYELRHYMINYKTNNFIFTSGNINNFLNSDSARISSTIYYNSRNNNQQQINNIKNSIKTVLPKSKIRLVEPLPDKYSIKIKVYNGGHTRYLILDEAN